VKRGGRKRRLGKWEGEVRREGGSEGERKGGREENVRTKISGG